MKGLTFYNKNVIILQRKNTKAMKWNELTIKQINILK